MTSTALPVAAGASGGAREGVIPKATLPLTFKWLQHADDWSGFGPDEQALLFGHLRFRNAVVQAGSGAAKTVHFEHQLELLAKELPGEQLCSADHWATSFAGSLVIPSLARVTEPTPSAAAVLTAAAWVFAAATHAAIFVQQVPPLPGFVPAGALGVTAMAFAKTTDGSHQYVDEMHLHAVATRMGGPVGTRWWHH